SFPVGTDDKPDLYGRVWFFHDISEEEKVKEKLRSLASELTISEERERRRIAVALHDHIGQLLALSEIKLEKIKALSPKPTVAAAVEQVRELLSEAADRARHLTTELSPPI